MPTHHLLRPGYSVKKYRYCYSTQSQKLLSSPYFLCSASRGLGEPTSLHCWLNIKSLEMASVAAEMNGVRCIISPSSIVHFFVRLIRLANVARKSVGHCPEDTSNWVKFWFKRKIAYLVTSEGGIERQNRGNLQSIMISKLTS